MNNLFYQVLKINIGSGNILSFEDGINEKKFAFTVNMKKEPLPHFKSGSVNNRVFNTFNRMKTISCRATIMTRENIPYVLCEVRHSTFRQNFDEFLNFDIWIILNKFKEF